MKFDLHCHSTASDGKLSPAEVLAAVAATDVELFALTDHDTLGGYLAVANSHWPFRVIPGIELSTVWAGVSVHVVGLDFRPDHPSILNAVKFLREAREERAFIIDDRLARKGMPGTLQGALSICPDIGQVGRPHFAEFMLQQGYVSSINEAFDRWLGSGKLGDVKTVWPALDMVVASIRESGGVAVLAHPLRYDMTFSKMRRLVAAFREVGGLAVEVVGQQASPDRKRDLQKLVRDMGMAGSGGSDFHDPDWAWAQIGRIEALPDDITPVWKLFTNTLIV